MTTKSRRVDIQDLGEPTCKLIREVRDSGDEVVLVDSGEIAAVVRPPQPEELAVDDAERVEREEAAWARFQQVAERITKNWTSPLNAVEAVEEQRR